MAAVFPAPQSDPADLDLDMPSRRPCPARSSDPTAPSTTRPAGSTAPSPTAIRSSSSAPPTPPTSPGRSSFAAETGLELAVRAGGHSLAGYGTTDGIMLDLSAMKGLHIDPDRRLAWAQPGLTAVEYTAAAAAHGLATPFGDTGSVGIAGLTLGGGIGWLVRKHGLAIDNLVSVEVVTADGRIVTASEDDHPDLFWAIRGGGGNFGVVTRFQFRLVSGRDDPRRRAVPAARPARCCVASSRSPRPRPRS